MPKTCIIAEIGTSHGGDLIKAIEMIHAAKEAGADTAKFQWVYADEIIHRNTGLVKLPTGDIPLYDRFKSLEQGPAFFGRLKEACESYHIEFLCTPFGIRSALELWDLKVSRFKIASPELNHLPLLEILGASGAELIISSGVSRLADIEEALETIAEARFGTMPNLAAISPSAYRDTMRRMPQKPDTVSDQLRDFSLIRSISSRKNITLLHCMTAYPSPEDEYNLLLLRTLRSIFGVDTGISDHSLDPVLVPAISTIFGATIIEKHFALSNSSDGLDDPIALNPDNFRTMVNAVRKIETTSYEASGAGTYPQMTAATSASIYVLERLAAAGIDADPELIGKVIGNGIKFLAPTEREHYGKTNRSLHAATTLKSGTVLGAEHIQILRSEKILRPGLHPRYTSQIVGRVLRHDVSNGEGIVWQDLLD